MYEDLNCCFTLRVRLYNNDKRLIVIRAFDDAGWDEAGRVKLNVEVRHGGKVIFPKGQLTCALHGVSDGTEAKKLVMSLVAMYQGNGSGVDDDYYKDYTAEQSAWSEAHGESLDAEWSYRYCDESGNPKA